MTGSAQVVESLDECLKYERTLWDCYAQAHHYMARWRIHRLEDWFLWNRGLTEKRLDGLMRRICVLDSEPGNDRYTVEPGELNKAADIVPFYAYFTTLLRESASAYTDGITICSNVDDSVSCHLLGANVIEIDDAWQRIEAKVNKIKLVGPELYLASHFHSGQT